MKLLYFLGGELHMRGLLRDVFTVGYTRGSEPCVQTRSVTMVLDGMSTVKPEGSRSERRELARDVLKI